MMNNCSMMGRLTRDPEIRHTKGDEPKTVAKFGIAVERDYTAKGEKLTDFFEVEAWQKTAGFAGKYLKKGQLIGLEGKLRRSEWKKQGTDEKRFSYYIEAKSIYFAEGKKSEPENTAPEEEPEDDSPAPGGFDPFDDEDDFDPFAEE